MARPLRIEFPGAIYHAISRGNQRRRIFHRQGDYERFLQGLEAVVLGFAWELLAFVLMPNQLDAVPLARPLLTLDLGTVLGTVAGFYGISPALLRERGNPHLARPVAAWLARRHTLATLRELAPRLGLRRPGSVGNLTRRIERQADGNAQLQNDLSRLEAILWKQRQG